MGALSTFCSRTCSRPRPKNRSLRCRSLSAKFDKLGNLESARAEQNVAAEMAELLQSPSRLTQSQMNCGLLTVQFAAKTNQVEKATAENGVRLVQAETTLGGGKVADRILEGNRADYSGVTGLLEITGKPITGKMPEGEITHADRLVWNVALQKLTTKGTFKSRWKTPGGGTNMVNVMSLKPTSKKP